MEAIRGIDHIARVIGHRSFPVAMRTEATAAPQAITRKPERVYKTEMMQAALKAPTGALRVAEDQRILSVGSTDNVELLQTKRTQRLLGLAAYGIVLLQNVGDHTKRVG